MADLMGKEPEEISLVFKGKMLDKSKVSAVALHFPLVFPAPSALRSCRCRCACRHSKTRA